METVAAPVAAADTMTLLTVKLEKVMAANAKLRHGLETRHTEYSWNNAAATPAEPAAVWTPPTKAKAERARKVWW